MNRIAYLLLLSVVVFFSDVQAQAFRGKIVLGVNASQIDGDALAGYNKSGLLAGAAVSVDLSDKFYLEQAILYSRKGARSRQTDPVFVVERLNYIDLPLSLNWKIHTNAVFSAFAIPAWFTGGSYENVSGRVYFSDGYKKWDLLGGLGAGWVVTPHIELHARLSYSLAPITTTRLALYNHLLSFAAVYVINPKE